MSLYQLVCDAHVLSDELTKDISNQLEKIFVNTLLPCIKDKIIANALIGKNYATIKEYLFIHHISTDNELEKYKNNTNIISFTILKDFENIDNIIDSIIQILIPKAIEDFLNKHIDKEFTIKNCKIIKILDYYGSFTNNFNINFDIEWQKPLI